MFVVIIQAMVIKNSIEHNLVKRSFWIVLAVLCIVFSSATKKLIQQRVAPYLTISQSAGQKIKNGCRDKRHSLTPTVTSTTQSAPDLQPDVLFFLSALVSFAFLYQLATRRQQAIPSRHSLFYTGNQPLYLQYRKLQI
jgi:hypothetical protein